MKERLETVKSKVNTGLDGFKKDKEDDSKKKGLQQQIKALLVGKTKSIYMKKVMQNILKKVEVEYEQRGWIKKTQEGRE